MEKLLQPAHRKRRRFSMASRLGAIVLILCCLLIACDSTSHNTSQTKQSISTSNGTSTITYSSSPQDVLIRTFYGGGKEGTLDISPEISIYGDGTYILGPGLAMREGKLDTETLQQLLHTLVDRDNLLGLHRQQFYDIPGQNATLLQVNLNDKHLEYLYGQFGTLQESASDLNDYHLLDHALISITQALKGPTQPYTSATMALLVHLDFSPDLRQSIPSWSVSDFTLDQVATYECGPTPQDQTGPNADTGCLTFTVPEHVYLPTAAQLPKVKDALKGQTTSVFYATDGQYYTVTLRPLLPDEGPQNTVAMFGSQQLSYIGIPLHTGPIPTPIPTPS